MSLPLFYLNNFLEFVASGTILYFGVAALAGVAAYVLVKWPSVWNLVMWLPRMVYRPLLKWVKATKLYSKVQGKVTATSVWKWLESKQYDPPARPLSWWAPRALIVLWFVVVGMSMAFWHGRNTATLPNGARQIAWAWKNRADQCQQDLLKERAFRCSEPPKASESSPPPPPPKKGKAKASSLLGLF